MSNEVRHLNKYWNISGGFLFDVLDQYAHQICIEKIGECVTSSAEIKYFKELPENYRFLYRDIDFLSVTKSTAIVRIENEEFSATFTFVKRK